MTLPRTVYRTGRSHACDNNIKDAGKWTSMVAGLLHSIVNGTTLPLSSQGYFISQDPVRRQKPFQGFEQSK